MLKKERPELTLSQHVLNPNFVILTPHDITYHEMLSRLSGEIVTFTSLPEDRKGKRYIIIRHDVDIDIDKAIVFAEEESKLGVHATYFLLETSPYWMWGDAFLDKVKMIRDLGHEIGLHNNFYRTHAATHIPLKDVIQQQLDFLRGGGIEVRGTSCHGDREMYTKVGFYNYEIWEEFDRDKNMPFNKQEIVVPPKLPMTQFGFEYEAYFHPHTAYLSDSDQKFLGYIPNPGKPKFFEFELLTIGGLDKLGVLTKFNQQPEGIFQLLIHPIWWRKEG